jgi:hypothetical protein
MTTVYHPQSWAFNWPKGAKAYASVEVAVAHGHSKDELMESPFMGLASDVVTEAPVLAPQEQQFVAENPGVVVETAAPDAAEEAAPVKKAKSKPSKPAKGKSK